MTHTCKIKLSIPTKRSRDELKRDAEAGDPSVKEKRSWYWEPPGYYVCKFEQLKQEIEDCEKQRLFNHSLKAWLNRNAENLKLFWFKPKEELIKIVDEEQAVNSAQLKEAEERLRNLENDWIKWKLAQGVQATCNKTKKG